MSGDARGAMLAAIRASLKRGPITGEVRTALEERLAESMPLTTQLGGCRGKEEKVESGFLI